MNDLDSDELAKYNSRVSKGIVHTKTYVERMAKLQNQFDEEQKEKTKDIIKPGE